MRLGVGDTTAWTDLLAQQGITTGVLVLFRFLSGDVACWTGSFPFVATGSGDFLLDGRQFEPIANGIPVSIGENAFSYSGSEAMTLSMSIPETRTAAMVNASLDPSEYQARMCVVWRVIMQTPAGATAPATWVMRRVRAGSMDELTIANDGSQHTFTLTIEAHASRITNATASSYLDQTRFDVNDTSQAYAVSIANNRGMPSGGSAGGAGGGASGLFGAFKMFQK